MSLPRYSGPRSRLTLGKKTACGRFQHSLRIDQQFGPASSRSACDSIRTSTCQKTLRDFTAGVSISLAVYISRSLILDHVEFHMAFEEDDLKKISSGDKSYDYLATFRKLNVVRSFKIYLLVTSLENWHQMTDKEVEKRKKELKLKYEPLVREFMLPDSLRSLPTNASLSATSRSQPALPCDDQPQLPHRVSVRRPPTLPGILQHLSNLQSRTQN
jgi:hypothetical protein